MKSFFSFLAIILICTSCSTGKQISESESSSNVVMTGNVLVDVQNLIDSYSGDKDALRKIESLLMPLVLKNDLEALCFMVWVERKKGYVNDSVGYTADSLLNASKYLKKAKELYPQSPLVKIAEASFLVDSKRYAEANQQIALLKNDQSQFNDSEKFRLFFLSSNNLLLQRKYQEALIESEKCRKFAFEIPLRKFHCVGVEALSYRYLNMHEKSIEKHLEVYDLKPSRWTKGNLGLALFQAGKFERGIRILETINTKDSSPDLYFNALNHAYLSYGNTFAETDKSKSLEFYNKIDYKRLEDVELLERGSGNLLYFFNDTSLSFEFAQRALQLDPKTPKANFLIGEYHLYVTKDYNQSLSYYLKARDNLDKFYGAVDPRVVIDLFWHIGSLYAYYLPEKNFDLSIKYFTHLQEAMKKLKSNERMGEMYYGFATSYHQRGWETKNLRDSELALEYYKKSRDLGYEKDLAEKNIRVVIINIQNFKNKKI